MKILSKTQEGGRVVEMTSGEMKELYLLMKTCDPNVEDEYMATWNMGARLDENSSYIEELHEYNFSKLFSLVRAWRDMSFSVNKIKNLISGIENAIKNGNE